MRITKPDIAALLHKRELTKPYFLKMAAGKTLPIFKVTLVEMTIGRRPPRSWIFVAEISYDFILKLDVLCCHNACMDLGHGML